MKFVENVISMGRTGILSDLSRPWNLEVLKTPMFLTYTRAGTIPHLTFDSLKYLNNNKMLLMQTLPTTVEFNDAVESHGKGLNTFVGLPEFPFLLSIQDPGVTTPTGYNVKRGVSVWTHGGKKLVTADEYMKIVKVFQPVIYQALCDSDTPADCSKKRLNKALDHSIKFLDDCLEIHKTSPDFSNTAIFGTIQGGYDLYLRKKSAEQTVSRQVDGFFIEGFHTNGPDVEDIDFFRIKSILLETIALLPKDKPRVLSGPFSLESMLEAVKCGIDIFDSSYAYILAEAGEASIFPLNEIKGILKSNTTEKPLKRAKFLSKLCLKEKIYQDDFLPILENCECYTCTHYTRAYVNHLLLTSELLAPILLMIHNLHHLTNFFEHIRNVIESN